jgi:putative two-component system response regulator
MHKVLIIDDSEINLTLIRALVLKLGECEPVMFDQPVKALEWCRSNVPDLVIVDYMMPEMDGLRFISAFRALHGRTEIPVLMITANDQKDVRYEALLGGANDFLTKPIDRIEFSARVRNMLALRTGQKFLADRAAHLADEVAERTSEIRDRERELIFRISRAAEFRDPETGAHIQRMAHYSEIIARGLDLSAATCNLILRAAPMHDVGKIGIPDAILLKPGRLLPEEYEVMKGHTCIGKRLLEGDDTLIQTARDIAVSHHEHWDGNGYPEGLAGEEIPLLARICAVSDVFDALTSRRPYKEPWPVDKAIAWVGENAGTQFDPQVVAGFMKALPEVRRIRELYRDEIIDPNQVLDLPELPPHDFEWVRWDDSLRIGIDVIDEHHRYLFDLTNDLYEVVSTRRGSREVARVMKALDQYVQVHFRAEERMMDYHAYPALDRQKDQHGEFEDRLREFYAELHDNPLTAQFDVLVYLRSWLVRHILHEDAKLRELVA